MALFKAQDTMKWLEMNLSLIIPGLTFTDSLDANNYPIAKISGAGDAIWLYIHDVGNAGRVDAVTNQPQRIYSPHQVDLLQDSRSNETMTATVTGWGAGETVQAVVNGVAGTVLPFDTDNNTSAADLANDLATNPVFAQLIKSATSSAGVITITAQSGVTLAVSYVIVGVVSIVNAIVFAPNFNLRAQAHALCAKLGMKFNSWSQNPLPGSFSLASANLVATIRSDIVNPLTISQ